MKARRKGLCLVLLSIIGFIAYKFSGKIKKLKEQFDKCYTFTNKQIKYENKEFCGESIATIFSGVVIDFTDVTLIDDINTIELYSEFSSVTIKVPEDSNIEVEGDNNRSRVTNKLENEYDSEYAPTLKIKYDIKFTDLIITK